MPLFLRGKIFYFGDYESNRQVQGQYSHSTVPNANQRQGIFLDTTGTPIALHNPLTGAVYANGVIPQSDWSPLAKLVIPALPTPNVAALWSVGTGFSNNLVNVPKANFTDHRADARFDFFLSPRTTAFFRWSYHRLNIVDAEPLTGPAGGNGNGTIHDYNKQIAAGYTFLFNQNSILDARVGFTWTQGGKSPYGLGQSSLMVQAGIPGLPTDPIVARSLSAESISNFSQFGAQTSNPQFQNPFVINPKLNYTMIKGRNSVKVGYEYQAINTEIDDFNPVYGQDTYGGFFSSGPSISNSGAYSCGNPSIGNPNPPPCINDIGYKEAGALADFLIGARSAYTLNNFRIVNYHQRMNFIYVQDDLKLRRNLTINAGLRYELVTPQYVDGDHLANFDPSTKTLVQAKSGSTTDRALVGMPEA